MDEALDNLEIIVGTYEEFLLGYKVIQLENEGPSFMQSFATHSHRASVRCVAASDKFLASGGTDESILLYDMSGRKEAGLLMHHHGNISCVEFTSNGSHLLSASEDGSIGVCRTGSWQLEKLWGSAHKGSAVTSISVHPSGKLFLSVGPDGKIRTWNLVKGRLAYASVLCKPKEGRLVTQVLWSPDGETYAVVIGNRVEIFAVSIANVVHTIQLTKKVTYVCFLWAAVLCVATEEGDLCLHDVATKQALGQVKAHDGRVRCMAVYADRWLVTASSGGQVKLWKRKGADKLHEVCATNTGCRITCITAIVSAPLHQLAGDDVKVDVASAVTPTPANRRRVVGVVTVEDSAPKLLVAQGKKRKLSDGDVLELPVVKKKKKKKKKKENNVSTAEETCPTEMDESGVNEKTPKVKKNKKHVDVSPVRSSPHSNAGKTKSKIQCNQSIQNPSTPPDSKKKEKLKKKKRKLTS